MEYFIYLRICWFFKWLKKNTVEFPLCLNPEFGLFRTLLKVLKLVKSQFPLCIGEAVFRWHMWPQDVSENRSGNSSHLILVTPCCQSQHAVFAWFVASFSLTSSFPSNNNHCQGWLPLEPYSKGNSYYMVSTKNGTQKIHDSPGLHFYVTSNINTHHYDWSIQENSEPDAMCMPTNNLVI